MFKIDTVLDLLQTTKCSVFFGKACTLFTVMSMPLVPPSDLNVLTHSVLLIFHNLTVPSELALSMLCPSAVNMASFTNEAWPLNSFRSFPDFKPWTLLNIRIKERLFNNNRYLKKNLLSNFIIQKICSKEPNYIAISLPSLLT